MERNEKPKVFACVACCTACGVFLLSLNFFFLKALRPGFGGSFVLHGSVFFLGQGEITIDGKYHKTGGKSDEQIVSETPITADNMIVDTWGV
jgi:hypothetical protein